MCPGRQGSALGDLRITIGKGGLPACARCAAPVAPEYLSAAEARAAIGKRIAVMPAAEVLMLAGAEAFGHPALPDLVRAAIEAGAARVGLETGGGQLVRGGNAQGALHAGVRHFLLHHVPGEVHTLAQPGALEGARELASVASANSIKVAISCEVPACRHTIDHLPGAVADLASAGVGAVHVKVHENAGAGPVATAAILAACDTGIVNAMWVDVEGFGLPDSHCMHLAGGAA